jgi:acyl carrier protein
MLPSAFVAIEAFPLSGNGKIDRAALPAPTSDRAPRGEASNDVLMSPAQHRVANIWKRVLKIERVGLHENFFDVGGHSLLVVQIQTALNAAFDRDVQIVELFNYTTVAAQAELMNGSEQEDVAVKRALARAGKQAHV